MATSKDVARLAGVSHTTVSRAFRGDVRLRPETYHRVMEAAAALNYTPNYLAASLKRQRSHTIGLINSDIANPFFMVVAERLQSLLEQKGFRLLIAFDGYDFEKQQRAVRTMIGSQAEAIIFSPVAGPVEPDYISNPGVHLIQLFGRLYPQLMSVDFDDYHGAYQGAKYLLDRGHRRILFLGGRNRWQGYRDACGERGATPYFFYEEQDGDQDIRRRLQQVIRQEGITALLPTGHRIARLAYLACKDMGLKIPVDISFLVFDELPWTEMLDITVISHPIEALAEALVTRLMAMLEGDTQPASAIFQPFLIERRSVARLE